MQKYFCFNANLIYMVSEVSHVTGCESKFALVRRDHPILGADISRFSDEPVHTFSFFWPITFDPRSIFKISLNLETPGSWLANGEY